MSLTALRYLSHTYHIPWHMHRPTQDCRKLVLKKVYYVIDVLRYAKPPYYLAVIMHKHV